ncbi:MAG: ROK family protein [Spirochaeta sp.]|jgi:glucokinase|nr:ROK family protein [Spirochaeta sp.]
MSSSLSPPNKGAESSPAGNVEPVDERLPDQIIAIDIGATKTVVTCTVDGAFHTRTIRIPTEQDPELAVDRIVEAIDTVQRDAGISGKIVALGCPGPLDPASGTIISPPNLRQWWGFPLTERLEARVGIPFILENDASLGALGEARYGGGRGASSLYYITLSTGIGAGYIVDGHIVGGYRAMAGEVWAFDPGVFSGRPQGTTILELASGPGLLRSAARRIHSGRESCLDSDSMDTKALFAALDAGDPVAVETVDDGREAIAGLILVVVHAIAPEAIVLAGGLCTESRWFVDPIRDLVRRRQTIDALRGVEVRRAALWDQAVLYGAVALAAKQQFAD